MTDAVDDAVEPTTVADAETKGDEGSQPESLAPAAAALQVTERILSAQEVDLPQTLLSLGGVIGDFYSRDGDCIEKDEVLAAFTQLGLRHSIYPALEKLILADAEAQEANAKRGATPSKKRGGTPSKRGGTASKNAKPAATNEPAPVQFSQAQFERLIVQALQAEVARFKQAAEDERKPATIIKDADVARLRELDPSEQIGYLAQLLNETDYQANLESGITVDFFVHHLFKCFEADIDDLRTAIFLTVMKQVLDAARETGWQSPAASFEHFKEFFIKYCDSGADGEYEPFSVEQARVLTAHVSETFFRFYTSFKFAFTHVRETEQVHEDVFVEEPLAPRPLSEATPC